MTVQSMSTPPSAKARSAAKIYGQCRVGNQLRLLGKILSTEIIK